MPFERIYTVGILLGGIIGFILIDTVKGAIRLLDTLPIPLLIIGLILLFTTKAPVIRLPAGFSTGLSVGMYLRRELAPP